MNNAAMERLVRLIEAGVVIQPPVVGVTSPMAGSTAVTVTSEQAKRAKP